MHYRNVNGVFVITYGDMTCRTESWLSVNEAERLRDALVLYLADMAPPVPDEPILLTGDA